MKESISFEIKKDYEYFKAICGHETGFFVSQSMTGSSSTALASDNFSSIL